jgi:AraC-like DNA-binding protein
MPVCLYLKSLYHRIMELGREESDDDGVHLRIVMLRSVTIDDSWDAADVRSTYWRFYVNSRDGAEVLLDDGPYPLAGRRVHLIPAWVRFTCRNRVPIRHLYAHVDVAGLPGPLVREAFPRPITLPRDAALEAGCAHVQRQLDRGDGGMATMCQAKSLIWAALARAVVLLPSAEATRLRGAAGRAGPVAPALALIEERLGEPLANRDLARRCGLGEDHFIRRFKSAIGITPAQHVLERRVARAAQLLLASDDPIEEIAAACGFGDRFYFTRAFTRRMGVPPARYRSMKRV